MRATVCRLRAWTGARRGTDTVVIAYLPNTLDSGPQNYNTIRVTVSTLEPESAR
ncbi:hypothetical protein MSZK_34860 [Mycobacterium sp. shizuoka-1]|nr:hypothetical protein MSZK_34860 [Mycobacterium sp. shizuoka-1]